MRKASAPHPSLFFAEENRAGERVSLDAFGEISDAAARAPGAQPTITPSISKLFARTGLATAMPLAAVAWDKQMRIVGWNIAAERLFGWHASEVMGKSGIEVFGRAENRAEMLKGAHEFLKGKRPTVTVSEHPTKSGELIQCEWHTTFLRDADGHIAGGFSMARDVTGERKAQRERERLYEIASAANEARDLDEILRTIRDAVIEIGGFDRVGIWLIEGRRLRGAWGTDESGHLRDERALTLDFADFGASQEVLEGRCPYAIYYVERTTPPGQRHPVIERPTDRAIVGLCARGEMIAAVAADNLLTGRRITHTDIQALLPLCEQTTAAIANARLLAERKRMLERQQRLGRIIAAISAATELNDILRMVRDAVVEAAGFDRASVYLYDREREILRGTWGTDRNGRIEDNSQIRLAVPEDSEAQSAAVVRLDQRYSLREDYTKERRLPVEHPMHGVRAHASVRLMAGGEVVGVIFVDNLLRDAPITREDIEALFPFADQAAVAIQKARLLEERARHLERQRRLASLAAAISASNGLNDILRMVRDAVVGAGGFDRAAVYLYDPERQIIRGAWGTNREGEEIDISTTEIPVTADSELFPVRVIRGDLSYWLTEDYTKQHNLTPDDKLYGMRAHAIVPLRAGREVVGILSVDNYMRDAPITEEDIAGLLPFADQAAVAIRNARLFEELSRAQEALVRSENLRAIGELASGVAHNINNILTAVLGYAELIEDAVGVSSQVVKYAQTIERAALDGADIVRRVQQFARREVEAVMTQVDLVAISREAIDLTRPAWHNQAEARGATIEIVDELPDTLPALGAASELREVVVNIIKNAADAMPEGGTLCLRGEVRENETILSVTDTGTGMEEHIRRRVFEPFFTTKGTALGTGLGLSVAWGIIRRHNGTIEVESVPGQGTIFAIRLPIAARAEESMARVEEPPTLSGLSILIVEDEELIADSLARLLTAHGANVTYFTGAQPALAWLEDHSRQCELVLTDHGMAGMTGMELLACVREKYPHLRRVLLSGWGSLLPDESDREAAELILTKPVRGKELMSALSELRRGTRG